MLVIPCLLGHIQHSDCDTLDAIHRALDGWTALGGIIGARWPHRRRVSPLYTTDRARGGRVRSCEHGAWVVRMDRARV